MYTNYSLWLFVLCFCRFFVAILKDNFNSVCKFAMCVCAFKLLLTDNKLVFLSKFIY